MDGATATKKMGKILSLKPSLEWITPPEPNGQITVVDVLTAKNLEEHQNKVREWAEDVWKQWRSRCIRTIEQLLRKHL